MAVGRRILNPLIPGIIALPGSFSFCFLVRPPYVLSLSVPFRVSHWLPYPCPWVAPGRFMGESGYFPRFRHRGEKRRLLSPSESDRLSLMRGSVLLPLSPSWRRPFQRGSVLLPLFSPASPSFREMAGPEFAHLSPEKSGILLIFPLTRPKSEIASDIRNGYPTLRIKESY